MKSCRVLAHSLLALALMTAVPAADAGGAAAVRGAAVADGGIYSAPLFRLRLLDAAWLGRVASFAAIFGPRVPPIALLPALNQMLTRDEIRGLALADRMARIKQLPDFDRIITEALFRQAAKEAAANVEDAAQRAMDRAVRGKADIRDSQEADRRLTQAQAAQQELEALAAVYGGSLAALAKEAQVKIGELRKTKLDLLAAETVRKLGGGAAEEAPAVSARGEKRAAPVQKPEIPQDYSRMTLEALETSGAKDRPATVFRGRIPSAGAGGFLDVEIRYSPGLEEKPGRLAWALKGGREEQAMSPEQAGYFVDFLARRADLEEAAPKIRGWDRRQLREILKRLKRDFARPRKRAA